MSLSLYLADRSQERTPDRSPERTPSRSSRHSVSSAPEPSDEELQCTGHFPATSPEAMSGAPAAVPAGSGEKFTVPPTTASAPGVQVPGLPSEAPRSRGDSQVNSPLLMKTNTREHSKQQQRQPITRQPAVSKAPQARDLPGSPIPPADGPPRPATVASRLQPADKSAQRIGALDDDDVSPTAGSKQESRRATTAQADLPCTSSLAPKAQPIHPANESEGEQKTGSKKQSAAKESPANSPAFTEPGQQSTSGDSTHEQRKR